MNQAYLFNHGKNYQSHNMLGARPGRSPDGESGYRFAVWAPRAKDVSVVGDFNYWDERANPLKLYGSTGIWTGFVPDAREWERYKYSIVTSTGERILKADPYARHAETRPGTASILYNFENDYEWGDDAHMQARAKRSLSEPLNIYELHIGSWRRYPDKQVYSYRELAPQLAAYLVEMGYNAVEFMPLTEYPLDTSWGYQVTGYFAATSRYGTPADLKYLIDTLHCAGISVIFDLVPGHFPKDDFGLARFDGEPLYEHPDTRMGESEEWGTLIFNYGLKEVRSFLMSSIWFWIDEFHGDGIRIDAVSSMIYLNFGKTESESVKNVYGGEENIDAVNFLRELNTMIKKEFPGVYSIAEESTAWPKVTWRIEDGGLGFTHKWNMGWMNDTLRYMKHDYYARGQVHNLITFSMTYAFSERFVLPFSHDEVVHGKRSLLGRMPGDYWRQFASLRTLYMYQMAHPGAKLNFMGNEMAPYLEWRYYEELEWFMLSYEKHARMKDFVKVLNHLYLAERALWEDDNSWQGFAWAEADDSANSVFSFIRKSIDGKEMILVVLNMTPASYPVYRVPVSAKGRYELILNSDEEKYGGSGYYALLGVSNVFEAKAEEKNGPILDLALPPLCGLFLKYTDGGKEIKQNKMDTKTMKTENHDDLNDKKETTV
jgi:1,4-alpha-glucan branching enzyme